MPSASPRPSGAEVVRLADVEPIGWGDRETTRFLLRAGQTGGAYSFYECRFPPGNASPVHLHQAMDEMFYLLSGRLEIIVDGEKHEARAGTAVLVPRGLVHSFANRDAEVDAVALCVTTPGGVETFFEELSELMTSEPFPGPGALLS